MTLYIDGYNLIFAAASRRMPGYDISRTEAARDTLLSLLNKYRSVRADHIMVFFDGGAEAAHLPRRQMQRGMDVLFSAVDSDADSDIKYAVSHDDQPRNIRVITSDAAIRNFVQRYGATVTESREFLDEVANVLRDSELPTDEPLEKYEGNATGETDYWMNVFGLKSEEDNGNKPGGRRK